MPLTRYTATSTARVLITQLCRNRFTSAIWTAAGCASANSVQDDIGPCDLQGANRGSGRSLSRFSLDAEEPAGGSQVDGALTQASGNETESACAQAHARLVVPDLKSTRNHSQNLHLVSGQWERCLGIGLVKLHREERIADQRTRPDRPRQFELGANERRFKIAEINA